MKAPKPDFKIKIKRNKNKIIKEFQDWCYRTGQPFPTPQFCILVDLIIRKSELRGYFLDGKKAKQYIKFVRKLMAKGE